MNILNKDFRKEKMDYISSKIANGANLYMWGGAQTALLITDFIKKNSDAVVEGYIVDDIYYSDGTSKNNEWKVYRASEAIKMLEEGDIVICGFTNENRVNSVKSLVPNGVEVIYFYFPYNAKSYVSYLTYDIYLENSERFEKTYRLLKDEKSRDTMEVYLNAVISGDMSCLQPLKEEGQYFNDITVDKCKGLFFDLGAYIGDTAVEAYNFFGNNLEGIVSFEPDANNITKYLNNTSNLDINIELIKKGSWDCATKLYFSSADSSSGVNGSGDIVIETDTVDNVAKSVNRKVGFIKMDVEGSELRTINGCQEVIQKYHPTIAVCVYHKELDLCEIPETIVKIAGEDVYEFYLRYYGPDLRELVMYAIPKQKI